jgi:hypothetical protein
MERYPGVQSCIIPKAYPRMRRYLDGSRPGPKVLSGQKSKRRGEKYQKKYKNAENEGME